MPSPILSQAPLNHTMTPQIAMGALGHGFVSALLWLQRESGKESRKGMCSLQPSPGAALPLQLPPLGPEAHTATVCASLRCREFKEVRLLGERFGLSFGRSVKASNTAGVAHEGVYLNPCGDLKACGTPC